jgi:hypothetical protein
MKSVGAHLPPHLMPLRPPASVNATRVNDVANCRDRRQVCMLSLTDWTLGNTRMREPLSAYRLCCQLRIGTPPPITITGSEICDVEEQKYSFE